MRNNAALGPDGLNAAFYKFSWSWTGKDVLDLVCSFYRIGHLPPINNSHIVLIPKTSTPNTPREFRTISLCNIIYKTLLYHWLRELKITFQTLFILPKMFLSKVDI